MNTGQIVKDELRKRGIKQKWLAKKMNIPQSNLSAMLNRELKVSELKSICDILTLSIDYVLNKSKKEDSVNPTTNTTESSKTEI